MTWDTIFKAGTHTSSSGIRRTWDTKDLDSLVDNFSGDVPVLMLHPEDQEKAASFGKIAELKRIGDKLVAKYADVPEVLKKAVKEGLKLGKSVSIDPVKMTLKHLGLLGAGQNPAVAGLGNFSFMAGDDGGKRGLLTYMFSDEQFDNGYSGKKKEDKVDLKDKEIKALKEKISALEATMASGKAAEELQHAENALKKEKEALKAVKEEFSQYKREQEEKVLKARVDALAESGRILPSEKGDILELVLALPCDKQTLDFSAPDGKTEKVTPREKFLRKLEAVKADAKGLLSEFAAPGKTGAKNDDEDLAAFENINDYA